jgi:1,4-alpha-glucan branching enzyme
MKTNRQRTNTPDRRIEFRLRGLSARDVSIVGDFNQWERDAHPMRKDESGAWTQTVTLSPGRYEYRIYADGQFLDDPNNPLKCMNCFGTENNVLVVPQSNSDINPAPETAFKKII